MFFHFRVVITYVVPFLSYSIGVNRVGVTREMREKLEEHTAELRNILQKSVYDRQRVAECYKNATDMIEQLKNDAQKYQSELNKVQKQCTYNESLYIINKFD